MTMLYNKNITHVYVGYSTNTVSYAEFGLEGRWRSFVVSGKQQRVFYSPNNIYYY